MFFDDDDYNIIYEREGGHRGFISKCVLILIIVLSIVYAFSRLEEHDKEVKQSLTSNHININTTDNL